MHLGIQAACPLSSWSFLDVGIPGGNSQGIKDQNLNSALGL